MSCQILRLKMQLKPTEVPIPTVCRAIYVIVFTNNLRNHRVIKFTN